MSNNYALDIQINTSNNVNWISSLSHKTTGLLFKPKLDKLQHAKWMWVTNTAWKVSAFGIFLVRVLPHSDLYSVRMRVNTDQEISKYWHFSRSKLTIEINCVTETKIMLNWPIECEYLLSQLSETLNQFDWNYRVKNSSNLWKWIRFTFL